jgi:hypothetical protein
MASSLNNPAWVEWMTALMGGVSRQTVTATLPPDRYYCLLDELPLHLIPQRDGKRLKLHHEQREPSFPNPDCIVCDAGQLPNEILCHEELAGFVKQGFALQGTIAWVRESDSGNLLPFWLGPQLESVVRGLRPDAPAASVPGSAHCLLEAADILLPQGRTGVRRREREEMIRRASALFRERGYAPLSGLIHPFHVAALRRYYRYLIRMGRIRLGDGQSPRRYVAHNEPVARFFHHHIRPILSVVVGESLKPSYVYLASYLSGAELKKHTDREQCEFSVTLCLDFSPEPALETPWPIRLDTSTGRVTVYQSVGDGLAYLGTRLPHYRDVLGEGQTSTSIFFHYVAADFPGSLD